MSRPRLELHTLLCDLVGHKHVYFQPPESIRMEYPAIVYHLDNMGKDHADNSMYRLKKRYTVTYLTKDPDDEVPEKLIALEYCSYSRYFTSDNLHHHVFELYY